MDALDPIPDDLRGVIFLVSANLDPSERATEAEGLSNRKLKSVIERLKNVW